MLKLSKKSKTKHFTFNNHVFCDVRTLLKDGVAWFVGKDVDTALVYNKSRKALAKHVDEDDALKRGVTDTLGRVQKTTIINESGVYSLIFSSKLPQAKAFKRWVASVVLPQIRRMGCYIPVGQNDEEKDILARAVKILNRTVEQQQDLIEEQRFVANGVRIKQLLANEMYSKLKKS